ncbi:hypothetical protein C9I57_00010 [Trinickia symbiotica]|uniref:Uncharacterized protein n=1 Tax=Trinickia symbiotica TaxID=863227 RepID=A0A2T3Y0H7_9BURK|nr:hypothetical protein C9I57_00010 [Trinickia symbiotica]
MRRTDPYGTGKRHRRQASWHSDCDYSRDAAGRCDWFIAAGSLRLLLRLSAHSFAMHFPLAALREAA